MSDSTITESPWFSSYTPLPGDLIRALVANRAWEEENYRGSRGMHINRDDRALIIQMWAVGNHVRFRAIVNDRIVILSSELKNFHLSWRVVAR
jgi:hypothetical protein